MCKEDKFPFSRESKRAVGPANEKTTPTALILSFNCFKVFFCRNVTDSPNLGNYNHMFFYL